MGIDFGEAPTWDFSTSNFDPTTVAGKSNLYSSGTGALFNFGFRVASGQDVEGATKSAADAGIVTYLTTALLMSTPLAPFLELLVVL
jgi:hypothetical protein